LQNLVPGEQQAIYNVSWSLSLEILFYALVPVVAFLIRRRTGSRPVAPGNLAMGVLIVWGLSFGWDAWAALMPITRTTIWLRMLLPSMLSMFCPGILLAVIEHAARTDARWARRLSAVRNAKRVLPLAAVLFGLAVIAEPTVDPLIVHELARQAFAICFGLVVAVVATVRVSERPLGRLAMWLGAVSYGVYLWHGALVEIIYKRGIWVPTTGPSLGAYGVRIVYLTALTLPLAWASWKFVEAPLLARVRSGRQWSRLAARG
jgi:peptidoglycan/LPS O-acetylase OafA/YrhL